MVDFCVLIYRKRDVFASSELKILSRRRVGKTIRFLRGGDKKNPADSGITLPAGL